MSPVASRLRRVGAWVVMLDLRDRAVRQRDKAGWVFIQGLLALCVLSAIFGLGEGPRWEAVIVGVVIVLVGRLMLSQNIRFGTKWEVGCTAVTTNAEMPNAAQADVPSG